MTRLVLLLLGVPVLAACGARADEAAPPPVRPFVAAAALLPEAGTIRAADGTAAFAVSGETLLRLEPTTRKRVRAIGLGGAWQLQGLSATGRWAGLARAGGTQVLVVDTERGTVEHELELPGRFAVEAISADGDFVFLQQSFVDGSYAVRGYDLVEGRLLPGSLGTKGETVRMLGEAGQVVASPDGEWLLTLYVETTTNTAFVHALNLVDRVPTCIPLPPCERCAPEDWTLALAADGRTLRATNGRGTTELDLARY